MEIRPWSPKKGKAHSKGKIGLVEEVSSLSSKAISAEESRPNFFLSDERSINHSMGQNQTIDHVETDFLSKKKPSLRARIGLRCELGQLQMYLEDDPFDFNFPKA